MVYFRLNDYTLLEFIYSEDNPITYSTNDVGFRILENQYDGSNTILNDNDAVNKTGNVVDFTSTPLGDGSYAFLDNDSAVFYPDNDDKINISDISVSTPYSPEYNRVRVHLLSGYNFDEYEGFILGIYFVDINGNKQYLSNLAYLKSDPTLLYYNPRSIKISELIFDKYIEIDILSHKYLRNLLTATEAYGDLLPNGIKNQPIIYCEFKQIHTTRQVDGLVYLDVQEGLLFSLADVDKFGQLAANVEESDVGDYFEIYPTWGADNLESLIYNLNAKAGNDFYAIHQFRIIEQVGNAFTTTADVSIIQTQDYDERIQYRPIIKNANATAFTIEYTIRLYNRTDGRSIVKVGSLTSNNVNKYGKFVSRINVDTNNPIKIYNKITSTDGSNVLARTPISVIKNVISRSFIDVNEIRVKSDGDLDSSSDTIVKINPFDNLVRFDLYRSVDGEDRQLDISGVTSYYMVVVKGDGTEISIPENKDLTVRADGKLYFKIPKVTSKDILKYRIRTFYLIANDDNNQNVVFSGEFDLGDEFIERSSVPATEYTDLERKYEKLKTDLDNLNIT